APFVEREIDDPAQRELFGIDHAQIGANLGAGLAGELVEFLRAAGDEEHGIAVIEAELRLDRGGAFLADIPGDRTRALAFLEEDIAEARLTLALGPGIHTVAEGAADRLGAGLVLGRNSPDFHLRIGLDLVGKDLEAGAGEM